jgi:hypothetical protein
MLYEKVPEKLHTFVVLSTCITKRNLHKPDCDANRLLLW